MGLQFGILFQSVLYLGIGVLCVAFVVVMFTMFSAFVPESQITMPKLHYKMK